MKKLAIFRGRRSIFLDKNDLDINEDDIIKQKKNKNFLNFLKHKFILKVEILTECRNFSNKFLISRNYSLPFNDFIQTLGEKMISNADELYNKINPLSSFKEKINNLSNVQQHVNKKIRKFEEYQKTFIDYLIIVSNENLIKKKELLAEMKKPVIRRNNTRNCSSKKIELLKKKANMTSSIHKTKSSFMHGKAKRQVTAQIKFHLPGSLSINNSPTIINKKPGAKIKNRKRLSISKKHFLEKYIKKGGVFLNDPNSNKPKRSYSSKKHLKNK